MEEVAIITEFDGKSFEFAKGIYDYLKSKENNNFSVSLIGIERTRCDILCRLKPTAS